MIVEYKTTKLLIAGDKRTYKVFETLTNPKEEHSILVGDEIYKGSLPSCKAFVDGYLLRDSED